MAACMESSPREGKVAGLRHVTDSFCQNRRSMMAGRARRASRRVHPDRGLGDPVGSPDFDMAVNPRLVAD